MDAVTFANGLECFAVMVIMFCRVIVIMVIFTRGIVVVVVVVVVHRIVWLLVHQCGSEAVRLRFTPGIRGRSHGNASFEPR